MLRKPVVAGMFYPAGKNELERFINQVYATFAGEAVPCKGVIAPHAGYVYSGEVAGKTYAAIEVPDRVIVLSPNHTGLGRAAAVAPHAEWETPLGNVQIDQDLAAALVDASDYLQFDDLAHAREHAVEVQLPFLQVKNPSVRVVPITMMYMSMEIAADIGKTIANVVRAQSSPVLLVASSDMNHYEPQSVANRKDKIAIDRVLNMDPAGLYRAIHEHNISMCGYIPAVTLLNAAIDLGAGKAELVDYRTSGEVSNDYSSVVGYAGIIVK